MGTASSRPHHNSRPPIPESVKKEHNDKKNPHTLSHQQSEVQGERKKLKEKLVEEEWERIQVRAATKIQSVVRCWLLRKTYNTNYIFWKDSNPRSLRIDPSYIVSDLSQLQEDDSISTFFLTQLYKHLKVSNKTSPSYVNAVNLIKKEHFSLIDRAIHTLFMESKEFLDSSKASEDDRNSLRQTLAVLSLSLQEVPEIYDSIQKNQFFLSDSIFQLLNCDDMEIVYLSLSLLNTIIAQPKPLSPEQAKTIDQELIEHLLYLIFNNFESTNTKESSTTSQKSQQSIKIKVQLEAYRSLVFINRHLNLKHHHHTPLLLIDSTPLPSSSSFSKTITTSPTSKSSGSVIREQLYMSSHSEKNPIVLYIYNSVYLRQFNQYLSNILTDLHQKDIFRPTIKLIREIFYTPEAATSFFTDKELEKLVDCILYLIASMMGEERRTFVLETLYVVVFGSQLDGRPNKFSKSSYENLIKTLQALQNDTPIPISLSDIHSTTTTTTTTTTSSSTSHHSGVSKTLRGKAHAFLNVIHSYEKLH